MVRDTQKSERRLRAAFGRLLLFKDTHENGADEQNPAQSGGSVLFITMESILFIFKFCSFYADANKTIQSVLAQ